MRYLGVRYTRIVRDIMATRDALIEGIEAIDELEVIESLKGLSSPIRRTVWISSPSRKD